MRKELTKEQTSSLIKLQATLTKISLNIPCFFNIVMFRDRLKLIKEFGTTKDNKTKWILTDAGKRLLSIQL